MLEFGGDSDGALVWGNTPGVARTIYASSVQSGARSLAAAPGSCSGYSSSCHPFDRVHPESLVQDKPFDFAQDKPFDFAQDKPFDFAQDKP
jgi:hypothetical protein